MTRRYQSPSAAALIALAVGCQTTTTTTTSTPGMGGNGSTLSTTTTQGPYGTVAAIPPPAADPNEPLILPQPSTGLRSIDDAVGADPSVVHIEAIQEALVRYYVDHRRLPDSLTELRTPAGDPLDLSSPATGRPYVYNKIGLTPPARAANRYIVYDPAPDGSGNRMCLVVPRPKVAGTLAINILPVPEEAFKTFQPAE